ncbi:MAG TPA: DUF4019 domain-containing protein [Pyrinomonadaceae bacterium]
MKLIPALLFLALASCACALTASREGIPPQAQATIDSVTAQMDAGSYEQIYEEAAEEWKRTSTPEQSKAFFNTLKSRLGNVKSRSFHTAKDQQNAGGDGPGHSFVITYQTRFERAEGMETFTLLERDGRWLLAGYFVNSDALK